MQQSGAPPFHARPNLLEQAFAPGRMVTTPGGCRAAWPSPITVLAARDCSLDHPGSMSLALKTGAAAGAVRNLISDLAASAFLLALDTHAMKTR